MVVLENVVCILFQTVEVQLCIYYTGHGYSMIRTDENNRSSHIITMVYCGNNDCDMFYYYP